MKQWQYMIQKFHENQNVLFTLDFATDPHLSCEYRRILCSDLKRKGYQVEVTKAGPRSWKYRLLEHQPNLLEVA